MQLVIPAKIEASSSGGSAAQNYQGYIDLNYKAYNTRLIQFSVPNAFTAPNTNLSQTEFGIAEMPSRYSQLNAWNSAFALAIAVGNGALNLHSITREFISDIKDIKLANIRFGIIEEGPIANMCIGLDFTTKKISSRTKSLNPTDVLSTTPKGRGFIVSNGGNYFIVHIHTDKTIRTIPCDVNGNIINGTINTATGGGTMPGSQIICAKGAYFRTLDANGSTGPFISGQLYTISSTGVITTVGAKTTIFTHLVNNFSTTTFFADGYIKNNNCYFAINALATTQYSIGGVGIIDMTNVSVFTFTSWRKYENFLTFKPINVGFDGTTMLISTDTSVLSQVSGSDYIDFLIAPFTTGLMYQKNSKTKMTDVNSSIGTISTNTNFQILGQKFLSNTTNLHNQILPVYNITGSNESDDESTLKKLIVKQAFSNVVDGFSLDLNGSSLGYDIIGDGPGMLVISNTYTLATGTKYLDFELKYTNPTARQTKIGFQITGGTYGTPTGANNTTGNATAGRTANANSSYIDLTVS